MHEKPPPPTASAAMPLADEPQPQWGFARAADWESLNEDERRAAQSPLFLKALYKLLAAYPAESNQLLYRSIAQLIAEMMPAAAGRAADAAITMPEAALVWWGPACLRPPFRPGVVTGNNDGKVWDATESVVADCGGYESRANVIAALLNAAAEMNPASRAGQAVRPAAPALTAEDLALLDEADRSLATVQNFRVVLGLTRLVRRLVAASAVGITSRPAVPGTHAGRGFNNGVFREDGMGGGNSPAAAADHAATPAQEAP